jgi:NAD(P)-dependent dehydrogenase (short-subunit alcohol dehydrogenase family)
MRLQGKVAVVTGAAQGIGRQIALTYAREGARVVVGDVKDEGGETTVEEITTAGGSAIYRLCDVSSPEHVQSLIEAATSNFGRLDVLVNNAAAWKGGTVVDMPVADWELGRGTILDAAFYTCKYAIPAMIAAGGGSIISISSVHGLLAARRSAAYEAAKGGLILLMKQVACDFGPQGIRANCICPGLIATEKNRMAQEQPERARYNAEIYPVRRYGTPQDIANTALFLAGDEATFISGQAIAVDGGLTAQLQDDIAYRMTEYGRQNDSRQPAAR